MVSEPSGEGSPAPVRILAIYRIDDGACGKLSAALSDAPALGKEASLAQPRAGALTASPTAASAAMWIFGKCEPPIYPARRGVSRVRAANVRGPTPGAISPRLWDLTNGANGPAHKNRASSNLD